jgi:hypothetical protein
MRLIDTIYVHHSVSNRDTTTVGMIRGWHLERGFRDIGYHFVITGDGIIHVGRSICETGAHVRGHNRHSIGICVTGNFETERPSHAQQRALTHLINSLRTILPDAANVKGHRDIADTLCPGASLHQFLACLR